jgi:hypothetical protein
MSIDIMLSAPALESAVLSPCYDGCRVLSLSNFQQKFLVAYLVGDPLFDNCTALAATKFVKGRMITSGRNNQRVFPPRQQLNIQIKVDERVEVH